MRMLRTTIWGLLLMLAQLAQLSAAEPYFKAQEIFDPEVKSHGHVHASAIVVCPDGSLRAVWYENGPDLPSPRYYNTHQDKNDNVRIAGSRRAPGAAGWDEPSVMADTFGTADNNPTLVVDADGRLWLFYSTMLGVPKWTWASSLLQYKISDDYQKPGTPVWKRDGLLIPHPLGIDKVLDGEEAALASPEGRKLWGDKVPEVAAYLKELRERSEDPMKLKFGWMPRAHPLILADGTLIIPLANENFDIPMMALTSDGGETWTFSDPVPGAGMIQPSLVQMRDGSLQAYFRNGDPRSRVKRSYSTDGGKTWTAPEITDRLHPGGGLEAILLKSGNLALVYNNTTTEPRDKLAVSLSDDQGKTWKWTRQLEDEPGGRFDYPSIVQAPDGTIHVTYSYHLRTIKHVEFNEEWVKAGEGE